MVVNHIHNYADAVFVESVDCLLQLPNPDLSVEGVGGIGALREIEINRVVAPVILAALRTGLIHGTVVVDGQELDMGDPQCFNMGKPRGEAVGGCGVFLRQGQELSFVFHAGGGMDG